MTEALWRLLLDNRRAKKQGPAALAQRQRGRLADMVAFARTHSPYYGELYRDVPERVADPSLLPVTTKAELMRRFDDWATDRQVTLEAVRALVDDQERIGEAFLGRYALITTSGTTGTRGIFVLDQRTLTVSAALTVRMVSAWLTPADVLRIGGGGGRTAMVIATGGHFASVVAATRLRQSSRRRARSIRVFSVHAPSAQTVAGLNGFRPAILAPYASVGLLLAGEQQAGRLQINPTLVVLSAEGLAPAEYDRIAAAFGAKVRHGYAASECTFLSYSCGEGWLHVNTDWVVAEPVDAEYRPVPPGEQSHSVLITNLANRVQPILRDDLGDAVLQRPDPCPCGDPLPAIRVQGRAADFLTFPTGDGEEVVIAPLAFGALADSTPGAERIQIAQTTPATLRVRLQVAACADPDRAWDALHSGIERLLADHHLGDINIERAGEPPEQSAGGKYRTVIPLRPPATKLPTTTSCFALRGVNGSRPNGSLGCWTRCSSGAEYHGSLPTVCGMPALCLGAGFRAADCRIPPIDLVGGLLAR